jgi:hypothetical protein
MTLGSQETLKSVQKCLFMGDIEVEEWLESFGISMDVESIEEAEELERLSKLNKLSEKNADIVIESLLKLEESLRKTGKAF